MGNKILYGLKSLYYATLIEDEQTGAITYGTPKRIPGADSITLSPVGDNLEIYADDMLYVSEGTNAGYKGDLAIYSIPLDFEKDALGAEEDESHGIIENSNAKGGRIALLFEVDGDSHQTRFAYYNVTISRPNVENKTKKKTKDPQLQKLPLVIAPHPTSYDIRYRQKPGDAKYNDWFSEVVLPNRAAG